LGVSHFAFFRSYMEALPLDQSADRYLETGSDLRAAKKTLAWIRSELIAAAKRYAQETGVTQASMARLLRISPEKVTVDDRVALSELPDLEEFRAEHDPGGFYAEAELIAEFEKLHVTPENAAALRIARRNARLRKRTNQALKVLESWLATTPKSTDPIAIWLHPSIVKRLSSGETGILTIEDLVAFINLKGHLWHRRITGFGAMKARRVIAWLQLNRVLPLNEFALVPFRTVASRLPGLRPKQTGIVPLEHLALGVDRDGTLGSNRHPEPKLDARTDRDAIEAWLSVKAGDNANTLRAYRMQAERFLLWSLFERQKPLSSVVPEDCADYLLFLTALADPKAPWTWELPREDWIGPKTNKRWHPDWKPFTGSMTPASRRQGIIILKGVFGFLVRTRYLKDDPWLEIKTPEKSGKRLSIHHVLNGPQWQAVLEALESLEGEAYYRLRFVLWILYSAGLRLSELVSLKAANLVRQSDRTWDLQVRGKGNRERDIPLSSDVMAMMLDYLEGRGYSRNPMDWPASLPLVSSLTRQKVQKTRDLPLAERTLFQLLKGHFDNAAERLDDLIDASQLRLASTHWLRHTFATEVLARGAGIDVAQELLGHADSATTSIYTHASRARKRVAIESLGRP
jgi:site-specific recombinase XerD